MRDISRYRDKILKAMLANNKSKGVISYTPDEEQSISVIAEREAIRMEIIPKGYRQFNINNLTGFSKNNEQVLDDDSAASSKRIISKFLWPSLSMEELREMEYDFLKEKFCSISNINYHYDNGTNVVIYGGHQKGKTLCASIIMNHIIDMHTYNSKNYSQIYDWISFGILRENLRNKNDENITYLKGVDWLVIDDIIVLDGNSRQASKYDAYLLDSFFLSRIEDELPTIFVFNFDITSKTSIAWEDLYGVAINKIISNNNTIKIGLF
jgi:hypothetical protein